MPALKNAKREAVLAAYIADPERVGWRAYRRIYPKSSRHAAETAWSRLLKNAEFSARRSELVAAVTKAAETKAVMELEEVLAELSALARGNVQDSVHLTVSDDIVADVARLTRAQSAAIGELTVETYSEPGEDVLEEQGHGGALTRRTSREVKRVRFKLAGKLGALEQLRRHYEPDKHEHTGKDGAPIEHKDVSEPNDVARRVAFLLAQAVQAPKTKKVPKPVPKKKG